MKNNSDDMPMKLFGLQLESSLKQINARLNELGILCCDGVFSRLRRAEKIAPRIALLYNTREAIKQTLSTIGENNDE